MVTLQAIFDRETAGNPAIIRTQDELDAVIERVRTLSTGHPCPAIVEITDADDPWNRPFVNAGIGEHRGFVQENWEPPRATLGDPGVEGVVVYDIQGSRAEIPADQEVSLDVVREVLAAHLSGGGRAPDDFPLLRVVD
ncbi:hypothetical protein GCM10022243_34030 [Saccharothrix violaceirubra]|uniref:Immunity protein Imm1 n=1 Tax=Saccharothrix violaceirubra TaxID=413306 RepID=A0A7W7T4N4_9PSEU|nr:Imm1 family immunity protein [Saccharothrix violaceirubra]MBB4966456.1 hypothetical protein [Saccharothrix violaceirubra]